MNGFLLAAGFGTRFKPFTDKIAKPAIPLLNIPMAFYNLHLLQQLGLEKVVVNTHHLPESVVEVFTNSPPLDSEIIFSHETPKILGTGGAIKFGRAAVEGSGTFVMANADVVNVLSLREALTYHHSVEPMATMVVMEHPEAGKTYGAVWVGENDEVLGFGKSPPAPGARAFHFVGIHFIEESIFKYVPDGPSSILDIYSKAIAAGEKVMAFNKTSLWYDAGNLKDYLKATEDLLSYLPRLQHQPFFLSLFRRFWPNFDTRPNLWEGEKCEHFLDLGFSRKTLLGSRCQIDKSVKVSGFTVFGNGAIVKKNVELHNVVVGPGVIVEENQKYSDTLLL